MDDGAVIPQERTAVPVEWDDLRDQLEKLNRTLAPTQPGGVSHVGRIRHHHRRQLAWARRQHP